MMWALRMGVHHACDFRRPYGVGAVKALRRKPEPASAHAASVDEPGEDEVSVFGWAVVAFQEVEYQLWELVLGFELRCGWGEGFARGQVRVLLWARCPHCTTRGGVCQPLPQRRSCVYVSEHSLT